MYILVIITVLQHGPFGLELRDEFPDSGLFVHEAVVGHQRGLDLLQRIQLLQNVVQSGAFLILEIGLFVAHNDVDQLDQGESAVILAQAQGPEQGSGIPLPQQVSDVDCAGIPHRLERMVEDLLEMEQGQLFLQLGSPQRRRNKGQSAQQVVVVIHLAEVTQARNLIRIPIDPHLVRVEEEGEQFGEVVQSGLPPLMWVEHVVELEVETVNQVVVDE